MVIRHSPVVVFKHPVQATHILLHHSALLGAVSARESQLLAVIFFLHGTSAIEDSFFYHYAASAYIVYATPPVLLQPLPTTFSVLGSTKQNFMQKQKLKKDWVAFNM